MVLLERPQSLLLILSLLCALPCSALDPTPQPEGTPGSWDALLARIERAFSEVKTIQSRFVQEKELAVFQDKVILKGRMVMENPGRLAWRVEEPVRYAFLLSEKTLQQWDEETGKVQKMSLSSNPAFEIVDSQLRGWFSGRYRELSKDYEVAVQGEAPCRLAFVPRPSSVIAKAVRSVTVELREDLRYLRSIEIMDLNGDRTRYSFEETRLNEPIEPKDWEIVPREP